MTEAEALQEYSRTGCQSAFAALVGRHADLVYSCALRQVHGDRHMAEDVTQAVFILLAKKARSLRREQVLAAWLITATRYASLDALKAQTRRRKHERKAAEMATTYADLQAEQTEREWEQVKEVLDDGLSRLRDKDRQAIMLRFYERKTFGQVGAALGIDEEAARKRVFRATMKLRTILAGRGGAISMIGLATILYTKVAHASAPADLVARLTSEALAAAGVAAAGDPSGGAEGRPDTGISHDAGPMFGGDSHSLANSVGTRLSLIKVRTVAAWAAGFVLVCAISGLLVHKMLTTPREPRAPEPSRHVDEPRPLPANGR